MEHTAGHELQATGMKRRVGSALMDMDSSMFLSSFFTGPS